MNKLSALSKLANAYYHIVPQAYPMLPGTMEDRSNFATTQLLYDKFNYVRRSLRIEDLAPQPKQPAEGLNPVGPKFF